ncbi:MAG: M1 family aminopeptidase [Anaerolineae bacterium]|nr:M1 family aminopeptidase [Anaerolineae bacterium]
MSDATPVAVVIQPTTPYIQIAQVETLVPTELRPIPTQLLSTDLPLNPTPEPTLSPYTCGVESQGENAQHEVIATIDYAAKTVQVSQSIRYTNNSDVAFPEIVLNVEANNTRGSLIIQRVSLAERDVQYGLNQKRLTIPLPTPMNPGCQATIEFEFALNVPQIGIGISAARGFFGYSVRQLNLGLWLATVAPRIDNGWAVHETYVYGEQTILEEADWDVTLIVENASGDMKIAAPGEGELLEPNRWHFIYNSARDFSISLSEDFIISRDTTANGILIELFHYGDTVRQVNGATLNGAPHALSAAVLAAEQYTSLFGMPNSNRIVIVQGDFPDGMEFSGLVYVSTNWFYAFEGGIQNFLTLITVHEVAHQWWYAKVGNDAAYDPWLDEAFSTYSEYIYVEEFYPQFRQWWWSFRVAYYNPQGNVDSTVYDFDSGRGYINAVYLRGAQMLHNIREDIGTEAFFDLLAAYAQAGNSEIATPELFWSLLTPEQLEATAATREEFLREPDVIPEPIGGGQ